MTFEPLERTEESLIECVELGFLTAKLAGAPLDGAELRRLDVDRLELVRFQMTDSGVRHVEALLREGRDG